MIIKKSAVSRGISGLSRIFEKKNRIIDSKSCNSRVYTIHEMSEWLHRILYGVRIIIKEELLIACELNFPNGVMHS